MSLTAVQFKKVAIIAARQADQKKGEDILLLDLRRSQSGICDYALMVSANSEVHLRALRKYLEESMENLGLRHLHREGSDYGRWAILDYGGLLIHVFHREARAFYALDRLWESARPVAWEINGSSGKKRAVAGTVKKKRKR